MLKAVFFDLDGTLLPINEDKFIEIYFGLLAKKVAYLDYEPKKLIESIWKCTKLMYKNDGSKLNCEVFWEAFSAIYGKECYNHIPVFDKFYLNEFKETRKAAEYNPYAKKIVSFVKESGLLCVLSTNPQFPLVANHTRMAFTDLEPTDFDFITAYDNFGLMKPNPMYFIELMKRYNLKPEEVIVFGNNELEDAYCATKAGIEVYLVGDYIIKDELHDNKYPHIKMEEVIDVIKSKL